MSESDADAESESGTAAGHLSWEVGPADSRPIRVLQYLAEGFLGGALAAVAVGVARPVLPEVLAGEWWAFGALVAFAVLSARWAYVLLLGRRSDRRRSWWVEEWLAVQQWRWPVAVALAVGAALVAVELRRPWWAGTDPSPEWFGAVVVAVVCSALAQLLSSKGELDPETLTLSTARYGERRDVDLRTLTRATRLRVGDRTLVWLSVTPGVDKRTAVQGLYSIPTEAMDRAWPAFEAGLAADPPIDAETVARGRFFQRVNRFVAAGFLALAIGLLAGMAWLGSPLPSLLLLGFALAGFCLFLLKLAA